MSAPFHIDGCPKVLVVIPEILHDVRDDPDTQKLCDENGGEYGRDEKGRACFRVDACIVTALVAVWNEGYRTLGCCCGHEQNAGGIITLDTGSYSAEPRTGTQERFAAIHRGEPDPVRS